MPLMGLVLFYLLILLLMPLEMMWEEELEKAVEAEDATEAGDNSVQFGSK